MFWNYVIVAFRNLARYKIHSLINILGLSIGIAISILIFVLVKQELSYDKYNKNAERIYRVNFRAEAFENNFNSALTSLNLAGTMLREIPEVEQATRVLKGSHKKVSYNDIHFTASRFYYTDQSFFNIFSIPVIKGEKNTLLEDKYTIVITEKTSKKYFGSDDPLGKILYLDNGWKFRITGVCKDVPENSHFQFDFLASLNGIFSGKEAEDWSQWVVSTYVLLKEGSKPYHLKDDLASITNTNIVPVVNQFFSAEIISNSSKDFFELYLQPLKEIHFSTGISGQFEAGRQKVYIYIFSLLAGIILFIACVNYMNLSTARISTRAREVAIRKVVGATRGQMIVQFFSESVFFSILATFLALVIIELILKPFSMLSGLSLEKEFFQGWFLFPILLGGAVMVGIFSGSYPSLYLSGFKVISIMKGRKFRGSGSTRFRGILVLSQFTLSIMLVVSSLIIYNQVKYLSGKNLGFNQNNIVIVNRAYVLMKNKEKFKELLAKNPNIINSSITYSLPGEEMEKVPFWIGDPEDMKVRYLTYMIADADFVKTMQMHMISGSDFNKDNYTDEHGAIINESAVSELGLSNPIGSVIIPVGSQDQKIKYTIIGVVKDYHFESLYNEIKPMILALLNPEIHVQNLAIRLSGDDIPGTMGYIKKVWSKITENEPFDYFFLDKDLNMLYKEEKKTAGIFALFSLLAIFIASLGLFGLAAHTAELRTREIGIRKAMGASVQRIALMLLSNFTLWILRAIVIAFPLSYLVVKIWLGRFAYHINIEIWFFFLAGILAIAVAILTVSFQSVKSAKANPIQALQYE